MNRNTTNFFGNTPLNKLPRSAFTMTPKLLTTMNTGEITPIFLKEIIPGETITMDMASAIRMSTPVFPVMDDAMIDVYYFFVPNRIVHEHWPQFMGEDKTYDYEATPEYEVPYIKAPDKGWKKGTIADYYGIPINIPDLKANALPFRGYCEIVNEWFRDQNLANKLMVNYDDTILDGANDGDEIEVTQLGAKPYKAAKFHDLFTSCLPYPQKGPDVIMPFAGLAPVVLGDTFTPENTSGMTMYEKLNPTFKRYVANDGSGMGLANTGTNAGTNYLTPNNLYADLKVSEGTTINDFRNAMAVQKYYELLSRGGSRYREIIRSMFGVTSPDARMQIPEYLGGFRDYINMDQVIQTSETTENSPQGNVAAYSLTNTYNSLFTKSFTEHGYLHGLAVIRTNHTYQQGLEKHWSKRNLFDYYFPVFANIGEQPVLNKEIYAQGTKEDEEVFGYQEPWYEHRYMPNRVTGAFRSTYTEGTLDSWHYGDHYKECPRLSKEWLEETKENMDRTLAVTSAVEDQFLCDIKFIVTSVVPLPIHSTPGFNGHF